MSHTQAASTGSGEELGNGVANGHAEDEEAAAAVELRRKWDELLAEAAGATDAGRQQALLPLVSFMPILNSAGIEPA